ncbi:MAG: glycosyltransferase [Enterocloster clostridioformis]
MKSWGQFHLRVSGTAQTESAHPLSAAASRGDQILNANSFAKQGFSKVLEEEALSDDSLLDAINDLYLNRNSYIQSMEQSNLNNAVKTVVSLIESCVK